MSDYREDDTKKKDLQKAIEYQPKVVEGSGSLHLSKLYLKRNVALAGNGGDWRSKSLTLMMMFSTTLGGFYFANCVLAAVFFLFDIQHFRK